jgi:hypothetical protein
MSKTAGTNHSFLCSIACRIRSVWYTRSFSTSTKVCFSAWTSLRYYECRSTRVDVTCSELVHSISCGHAARLRTFQTRGLTSLYT